MTNPGGLFYQLIQDLAQGKGIPHLIWRLSQILNRPVLLTNSVHRILACHDPLNLNLNLDEFLYVPDVKINEADFLNRSEHILHHAQFTLNNQIFPFVYLPLLTGDYCLGYCIVLDTTPVTNALKLKPLSAEDKQTILDASMPLLLSLKSSCEDSLRQEQYRDDFIRDILYNNYDSKATIHEKVKSWGWNLQGSLLALVIDLPDKDFKTAREILPRLFNHSSPISAYINLQLVVILNINGLKKAKLKTSLANFINSFLDRLADHGKKRSSIGVGIGSGVPSVTDLYKSYQEAKVAWELGKVFDHKSVCYFEEMGFLKFIFTQPARELEEFSQRVLGPLIEYDQAENTGLLDSLRVFIEYKCQIAECAKALYVHENTLRNRIKKIEQVTGFDLRRVDHMVNVYIALQVLNLGKDD
ncbi:MULTISPECIES: CdaR family transcriptional regulator [Desulfitobacterium]|uniref:Sugar diacid utilization regulator n=1 Tax=Desulfitobacterium dehalogenans (strain ATCC 51507 / DSM 9161 / JW/IU-DC1) TaxID=756499 RepID=I4A823_DESDJ|nr:MULTISPECIES: helix-turn-helix domain-containing protein [Desulfitobacterium]AFM00108.1 sugar diacid utilization regulator [Desulfitobacterium dehalogenans ATCC 51507]